MKKNLIIILLIPFIIALLAIGTEKVRRVVLANEVLDILWDYSEVQDFELKAEPYKLEAKPVMKKQTSDASSYISWEIKNEDDKDEEVYARVYKESDEWFLETLKVTGQKTLLVTCKDSGKIQKTMKVVIWDNENAVVVVNPEISSSLANIDKDIYYGEYDIENYVKTKANLKFNFQVFPVTFTSYLCLVEESDNISVDVLSGDVLVKEAGDAFFTIGLANEIAEDFTYNLKIVEDGVNVYSYQDLLYCTNYSKTGEIVVLRKHLESLDKAYVDKENLVPSSNNIACFGSYNKIKNSFYFEDEIYTFTTTYNKNYIDQWNEYIKSKNGKNFISDKVKAAIRVQKDFYGNGFTLNFHNLTFPKGKITEIIDGEEFVIPTLKPTDLYRGPLPFYTLGDHNGLALVEAYGQDNIGMYVDGDNITINDVNLKNCDVGDFLDNLETVGTVLETNGENITIKNSRLSNGKTIIRSFSSMNTLIQNSFISTAYNFLISIGSNEYIKLDETKEFDFLLSDGTSKTDIISSFFKQNGTADGLLNEYLMASFASKEQMKNSLLKMQESFNQKELVSEIYKGSMTILDSYLYKSNIASIAIESMFNGPFLYSYIPTSISDLLGMLQGTDGTSLTDFKPKNLSGISYPVELEIKGKTKFYDYKTKDELNINGLIKENISTFASQLSGSVQYSGEINIDKIFPIKEYLFNEARSKNNLTVKDEKEYINVTIAFYGGGLNISKVTFDTLEKKEVLGSEISIDLIENYLNIPPNDNTIQMIKNMMLKSVTIVTGYEPFRFICMDSTGYLIGETPKVSDLIENAKGE